jgi:hypothetical protein
MGFVCCRFEIGICTKRGTAVPLIHSVGDRPYITTHTLQDDICVRPALTRLPFMDIEWYLTVLLSVSSFCQTNICCTTTLCMHILPFSLVILFLEICHVFLPHPSLSAYSYTDFLVTIS